MMDKINLAEATAFHWYRVDEFAYVVTEPKTKQHVHFNLVVYRDEEGNYSDSKIVVNGFNVLSVVCTELCGFPFTQYRDELENIISNHWWTGAWGIDEQDLFLPLSEEEFLDLIPDDVKNIEVGIKWDEIDWFGLSEDDPGQRCLEYVEEILNLATEHCAKVWKLRHPSDTDNTDEP